MCYLRAFNYHSFLSNIEYYYILYSDTFSIYIKALPSTQNYTFEVIIDESYMIDGLEDNPI